METECKTLEFKLEKTTTYLKTVSAFANYFDGEINKKEHKCALLSYISKIIFLVQ